MLSARSRLHRCVLIFLQLMSLALPGALHARSVQGQASPRTSATATDNAPIVNKVEPPNWWIGMTQEVMVLLSGAGLDATKVECNLPSLIVERTQATSGGRYLFVWLKFGPGMKSGTAVCRITTPTGMTS